MAASTESLTQEVVELHSPKWDIHITLIPLGLRDLWERKDGKIVRARSDRHQEKAVFRHNKAAAYVNSSHAVSTLLHTPIPLTHTPIVTQCLATSVEHQSKA